MVLALLNREPGRARIELKKNLDNNTVEIQVTLHFEVESGHIMSGAHREVQLQERIRAGVDDFFHQIELYCKEAG